MLAFGVFALAAARLAVAAEPANEWPAPTDARDPSPTARLAADVSIVHVSWHVDGPAYDRGAATVVQLGGTWPLWRFVHARALLPAGLATMDTSGDALVLGNPRLSVGASVRPSADGQPYRALRLSLDLDAQLGLAGGRGQEPDVAVHDAIEPLDPMRFRPHAHGVALVGAARWSFAHGFFALELGVHRTWVTSDVDTRRYLGIGAALAAGVGLGARTAVYAQLTAWDLGDDFNGPGIERSSVGLGVTRRLGAFDLDARVYLPLGDTTIAGARARSAIGGSVALVWRPRY
jgi:hypothetical protein